MNRSAAKFILLPLAATVGVLGAGAAFAQLAPSSSNAPVDVTADQLEVQNQKCVAIYSGDAEALQATARLRANVINIYFKALPPHAGDQPGKGGSGASQTNCGQLDRMEA